MKKSLAYILMSAVILTAASCDKAIEREESPAFVDGTMQVFFPADNQSSFELMPGTDTIFVKIAREVTTDAATVELSSVDPNGVFEVPSSVSFAAGDSVVILPVVVKGKCETFVNYALTIKVDDISKSNPYIAIADGTPAFNLSIMYADYQKIASGEFISEFFGTSWPMDLYYSEIKGAYKFADLYDAGYSFEFKIANDGSISGGTKTSYGYYYDAYLDEGSILGLSFLFGPSNVSYSNYDPETKTLTWFAYVYFYDGEPWSYAECFETFVISEFEEGKEIVLGPAE